MGCGICVSECPAHAIQLMFFETDQFNAMIDKLLNEGFEEEAPVCSSD
jgi:heterodisulfide reductase subunit A-like polyferredoxin